MADNVITDPGSGGASFVTREIAHAGDTSQLSGAFLMGISGSEGSYTAGAINGTAANGLDVDVTRVIPGTAATHLGKAEDAAHVSGDTGVAALAVRRDVAAVGSGADGDYSTLNVDASGRLWSHDPLAVALLTTMDVDTSSMSTDLGTLAGAIAAGQMQVDVVAPLPAGDNNIGNVDIASSVALDVSAATVPVDNAGTFAVQVDGSALTALQKIDDPVLVDDAVFTPGSSSVMMAGFEFDDTAPDSVNEGDAGAARMSANRSVYMQIRDAAGNERGVNVNAANQLEVAGPVTNAGTFPVQIDGDALTALQLIDNIVQVEDVAHSTGDSGVMALAVRNDVLAALAGTDGDYAPLQVNASGALFIQEGAPLDVSAATVTVDNGGTFAVQIDVEAVTALQLIDDAIFADDAAFTLASSKVMVGGAIRDDTLSALTAIEGDAVPLRVNASGALHVTGSSGSTQYAEDLAHTTGDTGTMALAVRNDDLDSLVGTDGDYAPHQVTQNGALLMCPAANDDYKYAVIDVASSGDNTLVAAVTARKLRVLAMFMVAAGTVNARVESGAAGTAMSGQMNLVVNSGFTLPFNPAGWFETAANVLLNLELSAAVSVDGSLTYIEVP